MVCLSGPTGTPFHPDPGSNPTGEPLLQEKTPHMPLPNDIFTVHTSMGSEILVCILHPESLQQLCGGRYHPENGIYIPCHATSAPEANSNDVYAQQLLYILVIFWMLRPLW